MPRRTCVSALTLATMLVALLLVVPSASGRVRDSDHDGLSNRFEKRHSHTNPHRADSDRDKLRDRFELNRTRTKPRRRDTDRDALTDGYEWRNSKTSPRKADTDGDGVSDGMELLMGTNPRRPDHPKKNGTGDPPPVPDPLPQPLPDPLPDLLPPETAITSGPSIDRHGRNRELLVHLE